MGFKADIITLFPELFPGPLGASIIGRGLENGLWELNAVNLRDFSTSKHKDVDDTPSGGGPGMILRSDVLGRAIDAVSPQNDPRPRLLMSPRGKPFTQEKAHELASGRGVVLICGRFEGVDQRIIEARNLTEISIGDYVLAGGEVAAMTLLEATVRLIPGVLGSSASSHEESHENNLLEYPQYTRPQIFEGLEVPPVLISGDHKKIKQWRQNQSELLTAKIRPDMLSKKTD